MSKMSFRDAAEKILREVGKPLTAGEITEIAFKKGYIETHGKTPSATMGSRIYDDIKSKQNKSVFVKVKRGIFGLREWEIKPLPVTEEIPIVKKLLETQRNSDAPSMFEKAIAEAFKILGLQAKQIGGRDEPDIMVEIDIHKIILDGKSTKEGVITSEAAIGFERLERYKEKYNADYVGVIAPGFSEGHIRETAKKRGIILIETEAICRILQNHAIYPYDPNRIVEIIFNSEDIVITADKIPPSTIDQEKLIEIVARIFSIFKNFEKSGIQSYSTDTIRIALVGQGYTYGADEIEDALKFLSVAPFSILKKQNDKYSLMGDIESILKKVGLLLQAFSKIGR